MKHSIWDKRFPTLFGLFILAISTVALTYLVKSPQILRTSATSEDITPTISNSTTTSVTISFKTKDLIWAKLALGTTLEGDCEVFDDRDAMDRNAREYRIHSFTVSNLSPGQQYLYKICLPSKIIDNNGSGFPVKTANLINQNDVFIQRMFVAPVGGTVLTPSGIPASDAIVFVRIEGVATASTIIKSQGQFELPLTNLYTQDLTGFYAFVGNEILTIEVVPGDTSLPQTVARVSLGQHASLGTITLGQNITAQVQPDSSGFEPNAFSQTASGESTVTTPKDGEFVIDQKPSIKGKGVPFSTVEITVESEPQTQRVTVDEAGQWVYQPGLPLAPGKHTVSAKFFDGGTLIKVVAASFEVLASGSQVVESATPSATPPITEIPTPIQSISVVPTTAPLPNTATTFPAIAITLIGTVLLIGGLLVVRLDKTDANTLR